MKELTGYYIKKGDYYLQHFNFETGDFHYTMCNGYIYRYTTNSLEEIQMLNEVVNGVIFASHGCDIPC